MMLIVPGQQACLGTPSAPHARSLVEMWHLLSQLALLSRTTLFLSLLAVSGCASQSKPQRIQQPRSLDAYTLSGGKIAHFTPLPGTYDDPSDKMLLVAAGLSHLNGSVARSALVTFQSSTGNNLVGCLIINDNILVNLDDFCRQAFGWEQPDETRNSFVIIHGAPYNGKPFIEKRSGEMFLYNRSPQYIQITPGVQTVLVGGRRITLHHPIIWQDGEHPLGGNHIMLLPDLLQLFRERDKQLGYGASVRNVKIVYDIRDYHR